MSAPLLRIKEAVSDGVDLDKLVLDLGLELLNGDFKGL